MASAIHMASSDQCDRLAVSKAHSAKYLESDGEDVSEGEGVGEGESESDGESEVDGDRGHGHGHGNRDDGDR